MSGCASAVIFRVSGNFSWATSIRSSWSNSVSTLTSHRTGAGWAPCHGRPWTPTAWLWPDSSWLSRRNMLLVEQVYTEKHWARVWTKELNHGRLGKALSLRCNGMAQLSSAQLRAVPYIAVNERRIVFLLKVNQIISLAPLFIPPNYLASFIIYLF